MKESGSSIQEVWPEHTGKYDDNLTLFVDIYCCWNRRIKSFQKICKICLSKSLQNQQDLLSI